MIHVWWYGERQMTSTIEDRKHYSNGRWALEDLHIYNPYSGVTNNQSESLNFVLKELQGWKEVKIDNAVLAFNPMQAHYSNEIRRGLAGMGEYHVLSQYDVVSGMKEIKYIHLRKLFKGCKGK